MRSGAMIESKPQGTEPRLAQRDDRDEEESIKQMLRAAREAAGDALDDETPLSREEAEIIEEIRATYRRPTPDELVAMAKQLAEKRRS